MFALCHLSLLRLPFLSPRVFYPRARQRRDQSFSFPGTKFCSGALVNADDRKGFERERFYRSPQRISQCFTFHPWLFYLLLLLLLPFFSSPRPTTPSSSARCLLQARASTRGGRCMLNKIREWKHFRFARNASFCRSCHCFFFYIDVIQTTRGLIFRKILRSRIKMFNFEFILTRRLIFRFLRYDRVKNNSWRIFFQRNKRIELTRPFED